MKKYCLLTLLFLTALPLAALRCGDKAVELPSMKYLHGMRMQLNQPAKEGTLKVLTFIHTRAQGSAGTVSMLLALDNIHKGRISQLLITPDPESDAMTLMGIVRRGRMGYAVDTNRRVTMQYMAGSLLFPKSFVIDHKGKIIWCGETVDLGEMLQNCCSNRFEVSASEKVCPMLEEMQTLLRETGERKMKQLTDRIFAISPAHPAALRMRLFALENSNRIPEAWKLINERLKAAPGAARLYFTALDFVSRYPFFRKELSSLLGRFENNIKTEDSRCMMAWELLQRFQYNITALEYANRLAGKTTPQKPELRRLWLAVRARVAYLAGDLPKAISYQKKLTIPGAPADTMLEYFTGAEKLKKDLP